MNADQVGWILPEEVVRQAMLDASAVINAARNAGSLDYSLRQVFRNLPDKRFAELKNFLTTNGLPDIKADWPRDPAQTPVWTIGIDAGDQKQYIGDQGVVIDGDVIRTTQAETWTSAVVVATHTTNADLTRWLHHLSVYMLSRQQGAMAAGGQFKGTSLFTRDLTFDPRYQAASTLIYRRVVGISANVLQQSFRPRDDEFDVLDTKEDSDVTGTLAEFTHLPA